MYFKLNPECYFIKGKKHGAIFDLIDNRIYSLNKEETELIESSEGDNPVCGNEESLRELKQFRLGNFYTNRTYVPKMRDLSPTMESELERQNNLSRAFLEINNSCQRDCWFCGRHGIRRSLGCLGCNKWIENGRSLEIDRWKGLVDELRDLDCRDVFLTGGDLTLVWEKVTEILDYANNKFKNIYLILNQQSLSQRHMLDIDGKARPIIQTEKLNNDSLQEDLLYLLVVNADRYEEANTQTYINKNIAIDFVIKEGNLANNVPIISDETIKMPGLYQFLHNMRYHPCIGNTLAISYTGNVLPCPMMRGHSLGNIRDRELYTIFEKEADEINKFWKLTLDKIDKCRYCEFRYSCRDCRALEESLTGKLEGKKVCGYNPEDGVWA